MSNEEESRQILRRNLSEISRDLKRIRTGESKPDIFEYKREGDRFSILIRPEHKESE